MDALYELRPTLAGEDTRITYWFALQRRIVLLTVFRKTVCARRLRSPTR
ncbi:type II toxin-antitoxin system RelE/ParE family toxin [Streptomyces niger]|nr:type II toxin-antitoxin system RelE/ParE family toxin [Streptomyces niger]